MYLFKGLLYSFHVGTCSSFRPLETRGQFVPAVQLPQLQLFPSL